MSTTGSAACVIPYSTQRKCFWEMHSMAGHTMLQHSTAQQRTMQGRVANFLQTKAVCQPVEEVARWALAACCLSISTAQHSTAQHSTAQHSTAQHSRHSAVWHTPDGGLVIHGCHRQQEIGDVSNVHPQLKVAAGELTHMQCIIYVFAAGRINATDGQMPQVFPAVSAWRYQNTHKRERTMQSNHGWEA
jgi:hypothetical protein